MENPPKVRRVRSPQSGASSHSGDRGHGMSSKPSGKGKKFPFPQDTCYRCGKGRHQKVQDCKAVDVMCRGCGKKGHFEKVCLKGKCSTHSLEVPQASNTSTAGAGASEPLSSNDEGQPVYTYMVSVPHVNKHLIKFPIALDYLTLRGRNKMGNSTSSAGHSDCSTMLLKADTGADVNLMNRKTFDQLIGEARGVLQLTPIRMENYGNTAVKVLGMFHAFLRWKDKVYKQLFYITDCDRSPNLLSRDACYTLGVLKPCYTVEIPQIPQILLCHQWNTVMHLTKVIWWLNHIFIRKWMEVKRNCLTIPINILSWRSNFKVVHWQSRTSLTSTLMFSLELGIASWALTGAEKNYQNLERECLAMIWGM